MGSLLTRNELLIGATLGAYELVRFLGQGGTASVFEGRHTTLLKQVAVKVLHEHLGSDVAFAGRFLREGRLAAQLRHPHSIDVLDVGEERGVSYLVMELLDGETLQARLAEERVLDLEEALAIVFPVASALAHAHVLGVVHRDIKPANVFLSRDGRGTVVPKLLDFGLSKLADGADAATLTAASVVVGTVAYMAPEQTNGAKFSTPKGDQYSLAAVLYECLTGRPPFAADGFYELLEAVRSAPVDLPSSLNTRLPPAVDDVILRALHRDASSRYPSVRSFAADLVPFVSAGRAETWRRDFASRSSANMEAVKPPPEPRAAVGILASVPRDVVIAEKKGAPIVVRTRTSVRAPDSPARGKPVDWLVPYPRPPEQIGDAKHFRSTWLTASQATLRERGFGAQYEAALDPAHRAAVLTTVAGVWLPMDVAAAHYRACDQLGLTDTELVDIGRAAMRRANATALSFMTRMAQGAGITPWSVLSQTPRLWAQTVDDGFIAVARLGPKEARVETVGYPLANIRYNRVTFRGIVHGCVELFCQKAYVRELTELCDRRTLVYRLSWV